jgi:molybdenum cofactor cytidylyltransferase
VIPPDTTLVVPVVGIEAGNGRLGDVAHRPERIMSLLGIPTDTHHLQPGDIATLITHPQGGLKGVPATARVIPFINKVETAVQRHTARQIAHHILTMALADRADVASRPPITQVVIGAVQNDPPVQEVHTPVTAVILAAGQGQRMGETKQLLPWGEYTVLGQTIRQVQQSLVHDILVVTGHEAEKVAVVAQAANTKTVHNDQYASRGMIASLQTAIRALTVDFSIGKTAVLVMLADQPLVQPETIDELLVAYWQGKGDLIAPVYAGKRGNPVLISSRFFAELLAFPVTAPPRLLLQKHPDHLHLVPVIDEGVVQDLDTMADYLHLKPETTDS